MNTQQVLLQLAIELARAASDRDAAQIQVGQLRAEIAELKKVNEENDAETKIAGQAE